MSASTVQSANSSADDGSYVKPSAPGMSWTVELLVTISIVVVVSAVAIALIQYAGVPPLIAAATALGGLTLLLTIHAIVRRAAATRPLVRTIEELEAELFADDEASEDGTAVADTQRAKRPHAAHAATGSAAATTTVAGGTKTPAPHAPVPQHRTSAPPAAAPVPSPVANPPITADGPSQQPSGQKSARPHAAGPQPLGSLTTKAAAGPISPAAWQEMDARARTGDAARPAAPPHDGHATHAAGAAAPRAGHHGHRLEQVRPGGGDAGQMSGQAPSKAGAAHHDTSQRKAETEAATADTGGRAQEAQLVKSILERLARDMGLKKSAKAHDAQPADTGGDLSGGRRPADATAAANPQQTRVGEPPHPTPPAHARSHAAPAAEPVAQPAARPDAQPAALPPAGVVRPPADDTPAARLAAVADALANERVDVFLEPIAAIAGRNDGHYEVSVRLRRDDGTTMGRAVYSEVAAGTPLLPLIDTVAFAKSRSVAWRLIETKSDGQVFTALDSGSLTSAQFKDDVDNVMRASPKDTALRMVLAIPQNDVRLFSPAQTQALARLSRLGFRFAVEHLTDLETDFEGLAMTGFDFVKIDADVFLEGLPVGMVRIPAADICRYLEAVGLTPIVGHIRDDQQLAHLRDCGVAFGQGPLFGRPSLLRTDPAPSPATQAHTNGIAAAGPAG